MEMDITKVFMVRSAKGNDMLCVDNFLYHYEDRGLNSYRWVCNKRKLPCRSRIITALIDETDETQHRVEKVCGTHTHGKCTQKEVERAIKRKHIANLAGEPCTLDHKAVLRRSLRMDQFERSIRNGIRHGVEHRHEDEDDDEEEQQDKESLMEYKSRDDDDVEWADWLRVDDFVPAVKSTLKTKTPVPPKKHTPKAKNYVFKEDQLYLLKTSNGRHVMFLDGFLYRLEGKSLSSDTYRWECVRRRAACKARLYTKRLPNGVHKVRKVGDSGTGGQPAAHTHVPYAPEQLKCLLQQRNLTLISGQVKFKTKFAPEQATCQRAGESCDGGEESEAEDMYVKSSADVKTVLPRRGKIHTGSMQYVLVEDPFEALSETGQPLLTAEGCKKFTFLPSAKGNHVLCLDNHTYHFDSYSPSNGRSYWTCTLRRDKEYKCRARLTTAGEGSATSIVRVSSGHMHPSSWQDIKRRLFKSVVEKKGTDSKLKSHDVLQSSMSELTNEFKRAVANTKKTASPRVSRLKKTKPEDVSIMDLQNESCSSFSSELNSDDEKFEFVKLPKLDEMREKCGTDKLSSQQLKLTSKSTLEGFEEFDELLKAEYVDSAHFNEDTTIDHDNLHSEEDRDHSDKEDHQKDALRRQLKQRLPDVEDIKPVFKQGRKRKGNEDNTEPDMDITKVSKLRSAKGGELLCVDGYIYHMKSPGQNNRTYWTCIKCKDRNINCKSRVATTMTSEGLKVFNVTNLHSHAVNEYDIKRRLFNELSKGIPNVTLNPKQVLDKSLNELSEEYAELLANSKGAQQRYKVRHSSFRDPMDDGIIEEAEAENEDELVVETAVSDFNLTELFKIEAGEIGAIMKLYAVSDGPPSLAVRMTFKALGIPYELVSVDYIASEHMTEEYAKMNPQKEIPVLDDNGFYLSESIAIMQYLCDKYAPESTLYPRDATQRALINHRLCFNMGFYYSSISAYAMAPIFFDYPRNEMGLKKVNNSLSVFEIYLQKAGTKYAAANELTIADLALVSSTLCLEGIGFDLSPYPLISKWYDTFKHEYPELWEIANGGMQEIAEFEKNPPDLSHMNHPFHPTRKAQV